MKPSFLPMMTKDALDGTYYFVVGKYRGETLDDVASTDPQYLLWIYGEDPFENLNSEAQEALVQAIEGAGLSVDEVRPKKKPAPIPEQPTSKLGFPDMLVRNAMTNKWTFAWGKWKDKTLDYVADVDTGYLDWILRSPVKHKVGKAGLAAIRAVLSQMASLPDIDEANLPDPKDF